MSKSTKNEGRIYVRVGTPVIEKSRYGGSEQIVIKDRPYIESPQYSSLDGFIATLQDLKARYTDTYRDMSFDTESDCCCYHDCSCSPSLVLYGYRMPTQLERDFEKAEKARAEAAKEAQERAEFERLAAKFGK